jgi:nucleoside phosphorylase
VTEESLTASGMLALIFLNADSHHAQDGFNRLQYLAGRGEASAWQVLAWADHGVLGFTVMMPPSSGVDCSDAWTNLERAWAEAAADLTPEDVLGEARIFLGRLPRPSGAGLAHDNGATDMRVLDLVRAAIPEPSDDGWWQRWGGIPFRSPDGRAERVLMWEIGPGSGDERSVRRLAAVAPASSEHQADPFPWTNSDDIPGPLTRHLMHAARLRHQIRVFDDGTRLRQLRDELGLLVKSLSGADADEREQLSARLPRTHEAAITVRAELAATRHAVDAICTDLSNALSLPGSGSGSDPLSEDRHLATRFRQRLDDEITQLDTAIRNVHSVGRFLADKPPVPARWPGGTGSASRARFSEEVAYSQRSRAPREPWVVVFTALGVEYEAMREYVIGPVRKQEERGTLYEVGTLPGAHRHWHIALTQTGPGSTAVGVQLDRAIRVFRPQIALFVGVAGGRKDVALGDVVAADVVYNYEWGKSTLDGFQPRIRIHYSAHRLLQRAQLVARENRWQERIRPSCPERPPASFVKPIVTGDKVVAHDRSAVALLLDQYASDALAIETEGHGFLEAAYVNPEVDALVIRGISDLLAGKDKASDDYWQPIASRHAAAFAVELLDSIGEDWAQPAKANDANDRSLCPIDIKLCSQHDQT